MNDIPFAITITGNWLKKFFSRLLLEEKWMKFDIRNEENENENDE